MVVGLATSQFLPLVEPPTQPHICLTCSCMYMNNMTSMYENLTKFVHFKTKIIFVYKRLTQFHTISNHIKCVDDFKVSFLL
jgi:hypothetical protein